MTREEAIDVVKKNWPDSSYTMLREALETLIPELRESEDERIRKMLISLVKHHADILERQYEKDMLAYLEKQKEQKPLKVGENAYFDPNTDMWFIKKEQKPSWGEEDVDMLNSCISSIEEAKENRYAYKETDGDTSYDHEIAWLKSLRPSWKPSEEQMIAFRNYIDSNRAKAEASVGGWNNYDAMITLFEDLKNL